MERAWELIPRSEAGCPILCAFCKGWGFTKRSSFATEEADIEEVTALFRPFRNLLSFAGAGCWVPGAASLALFARGGHSRSGVVSPGAGFLSEYASSASRVLLVFFAVTASGQKEAFAPANDVLSRLRPNTTDIKPEHKSPKPFRQLARIESAKPMALLWPRVLARHGVDKLQSQPARFMGLLGCLSPSKRAGKLSAIAGHNCRVIRITFLPM